MRVLLVTEASSAGVGRHVIDLARGLLARGCETHLVYSRRRIDATFAAEVAAMPGLRAQVCDMRRTPHPADALAKRRLRAYVRARGPFDVVHAHSSKAGALVRLPPGRLGRTVLYTPHCVYTMNPTISKRSFWVYRTVERALVRWTDRIVAVSPDERDHLIQLGFPPERVQFIANGVDPWPSPPKARVRQALGLPQTGPVVGFVGRLDEQKNPLLMIETLAVALRTRPELMLAMVGDGPLLEAARDRARELGVEDRVRWLGFQVAREVLPAFDALALTSRYEGLPYVLLEALASGVPVVATPVGGAQLLIGDGAGGGAIAGAGTAPELAEALLEIVRNPARQQACSAAARVRAGSFTIDAMVDRTMAAYHDCLQPRAASTGPLDGLAGGDSGGEPASRRS